MTFYSRLKSIQNELQGLEVSELRKETGFSVQFWREAHLMAVFPAVFKAYAGHLGVPFHMREAASDASFVSAIYEWCQRYFVDDIFDPCRFNSAVQKGTLIYPGGDGTGSVGPFQAYARKAYEAIYASDELRSLILEHNWKGTTSLKDALTATSSVSQSRPIPDQSTNNPAARILQKALSDYETVASPMVSFIGKVALTMDYARDLAKDLGPEVFKSTFPRPALAWTILRSESTSASRSEYRAYVRDGILNAKPGGVVSLTNDQPYEPSLMRMLPVMRLMGIILKTSFIKGTS
jgi:hypothetical protein